jgi:hypothetical protein
VPSILLNPDFDCDPVLLPDIFGAPKKNNKFVGQGLVNHYIVDGRFHRHPPHINDNVSIQMKICSQSS